MGPNDREQARKEDRKNARSAGKLSTMGKGYKKGSADYTATDASLLLRAISNLTRSGGAIQFGYTSDGGAHAIQIYDGGEREKFYPTSPDELEELLREIAEHYEDK